MTKNNVRIASVVMPVIIATLLLFGVGPALRASRVAPMDALKAQPDVSGNPRKYAITGVNFEVFPEPASATTYQLTYFQTLPALSNSNTTNWLLSKHPDLTPYEVKTVLRAVATNAVPKRAGHGG